MKCIKCGGSDNKSANNKSVGICERCHDAMLPGLHEVLWSMYRDDDRSEGQIQTLKLLARIGLVIRPPVLD